MVGGAPYADRFIRGFTEGADPRILFPGPIYGEGYRELLSHALAYVHATEVGGTHPALVEAMGYGNCVVVNDTPENREAAGLAEILDRLRRDPAEARRLGAAAAARAAERYSWSEVADRYERLLAALADRPRGAVL
jgi:glycosyltransferase involved in cell wall biosynthesis